MTQKSESQKQTAKDGRKVLWYFLGFFAVFATVDAFFVYKALSTHSGVVAENSYEIGLHYNELLKEADKREQEKMQKQQGETAAKSE